MTESGDRYRTVVTSIDDALERAIQSHINGDLSYAKYVCQSILQVEPGNQAARHHLRIVEEFRSVPVMLRNIVAPRLPADAPVIFDVGAHAGRIAAAYRSAFPNAAIHAFEPDPGLFATLAEAFRDDPLVIANPLAVGDEEGRARFNILRGGGNDAIGSFCDLNPDNPTNQAIGARRAGTVEVEVTTIDRYCERNGIGRIDFLKLDVQGFEDRCLRGAAGLLERQAIGLVQVELLLSDMYSRTLSFHDIEATLAPHGYRLFAIDDVHPHVGAELFQLDAFYVPRRPAAAA